MIDFKTEANSTYEALKEALKPFRQTLNRTENDTPVKGAVTVFISGNRPIGAVLAESSRLVGIDGRPSDLGKGYSPFLMPIVSDSFRNYSQWDG